MKKESGGGRGCDEEGDSGGGGCDEEGDRGGKLKVLFTLDS